MRQPWPGAGLLGGSGHVRLCAGDCPPTRGVLGQFAHFGAAGRRFRLGTATVTTCRSDLTETSGSVGEHGNRDRRDEHEEFDEEPKSQAREAASKGGLHGAEFQSETEKNR